MVEIKVPNSMSQLEPLKPFDQFVAGPYAVPQSADHVRERVERNVGKFMSNYLLVIAGGLLLYAYLQPVLLLIMIVLAACVYAVAHVDDPNMPWSEIKVNAHTFTSQEKKQMVVGVAIFTVLVSGSLGSLLWGTLAPLFLCVAHAALKQTSLVSKVAAKVEGTMDKAEAKLDKAAENVRKRVGGLFSSSK
jgi:hypothetical protein